MGKIKIYPIPLNSQISFHLKSIIRARKFKNKSDNSNMLYLLLNLKLPSYEKND